METELIENLSIPEPNGKESTTYLTHNFHTYPAKFIPQIPRATIRLFTNEGDTVLDPFGGCGTTLVEAKLSNRKGIGVDINPIAVLVSRSKTTKLTKIQLDSIKYLLFNIKQDIKRYYKNEKLKIDYSIPEFNNINHWFEEKVKHELAIIKAYIDSIKDDKLKNYLFTAFSSIIVTVSNQESDTRFAAIKKNIKPFRVFFEFSNRLEKMQERILGFSEIASNSKIEVYQKDSRDLSFLKDNSIDHIVTSPPYANTYDYYLYHKFRIFWLGYDVKRVQDNEIGSRNSHSSKKEGIETFENHLNLCFKEMRRVLKPKKYAVIVIGDSVIRGNLIKADELLKEIAKKNNFSLVRKISYNLSKNSRMFNPRFTNKDKEEHVLFFVNEKRD